jgi:hypothetical protein
VAAAQMRTKKPGILLRVTARGLTPNEIFAAKKLGRLRKLT